MVQVRRKLQMPPHDEEVLRALYREMNIPTDQFPHRNADLRRLVKSWNGLTSRSEAETDVLHYMITVRKKGKWEKLGPQAGSDFERVKTELSDDELGYLDAIHEELQIPSDNYALNPDLAKQLQKEFAKRAGRIVPPMSLAAEMISRRKAGALATLKPKSSDNNLGFSDIGEVAI